MKLSFLLIGVFAGLAMAANENPFEEVFAWSEVPFAWPDHETKVEAIKSKRYIPENNMPLSFNIWRDKLLITLPRWKPGVPASLAYIPLKPFDKHASLIPYPNWKAHALPEDEKKADDNLIVNSFRAKVDSCDRLWLIDNGVDDSLGKVTQVLPPAIVVFDLKTDKLLRRYPFTSKDLKSGYAFVSNIIVDVDPADCDKAFAYVADPSASGLVVYSWSENDSWRIDHDYFHFEPLETDLNVGGVNYQWPDGLFGLTVGPKHESGYRTLYFHAMCATHEFSVSTQIIQNKTLATDPHSFHFFKLEGLKGNLTHSSDSEFDEQTNVIFQTQILRDGIACWNTKKPLNEKNFALIAHDPEKLVFTNSFKIDPERNLWVISNKLPVFMYSSLDTTKINYRILKANIDDLIKNTACEA